MKTMIWSLLGLFFTLAGNAQDTKAVLHPTKNEPLNEGIYMTFDEWKNNTPTTLYTLNIDKTKNIETASLHERLQGIPVKDQSGNATHLRANKVFAYYDGRSAYISFGTSYLEIVETGMFTHFTTMAAVSASSYGSASSSSADYFLDMNTGKIIKLTGGTLLKLVLADFSDLQAQYKAEKMKSMMLLWYLNEANGRYRTK